MINNDDVKRLFSTYEVSAQLGMHHNTLRQLAKKGKIGHVRMGGGDKPSYKFSRRDIEDYVASLKRVEAI